jgi:hypothetical protein
MMLKLSCDRRSVGQHSSTSHRLCVPICLMYYYSLQIKMRFKTKKKKYVVVSGSHLELMTSFFSSVLTIAGFLMWGALSEERTDL